MIQLLPLLNASPNNPRIVCVLNAGMESSSIDLDDLDLKKPGSFSLTGIVKTLSTEMTLAMSRLAKENPSVVFIHHYPGGVNTDVFKKAWGDKWYLPVFTSMLSLFGTSPEDAAEKILYFFTSAKYGGKGVPLTAKQTPGLTMAKTKKGGSLFAITDKVKEVQQEKVMMELKTKNADDIVWRNTMDKIAPYST